MKRVLIVALALAGALAAGWTGFWFWNRAEVKAQIDAAVADMRRVGVETRYADLRIAGFPFRYVGAFRDVELLDARRGLRVALPSMTAEVVLPTADRVEFTLPGRFLATFGVGGPAPRAYEIASKAMRGDVRIDGDGVVRRLTAASATLREAAAAGEAFISIDDLSLESRQPHRAEGTAPLEVVFALGGVSSRGAALGGGAEATLAVGDVEGRATGASGAFSAEASVAFLSLESTPATRLRLDAASVRASTRWDEDAAAGASWLGLALDGGATIEIGAERLEAASAVGEAVGADGFEMRVGAPSWRLDIAPERFAATMAAEDATAEAESPRAEARYTLERPTVVIAAAAPSGFALETVLAAAAEEQGAALLEMIRAAVHRGEGTFEIQAASAGFESLQRSRLGGSGRWSLGATGGPSETRIDVDAERFRLESGSAAVAYQIAAPAPGRATLAATAATFEAPLRAGPETQSASLSLVLSELALDDAFWDLVDPRGALTRAIPGMTLEAALEMMVRRDLLGAEVLDSPAPPVDLKAVGIERLALEALGVQAEAEGRIAISPAPFAGVLDLRLAGWRAFLDAARGTPFGSGPPGSGMLDQAQSWIATYGAAVDGGEARRFDMELTQGALTINGAPVSFGGADPARPNTPPPLE